MTDTLEDHEGTVSIGGRTIINFLVADVIDGLAGEEEELAKLFEQLDKASPAYGMAMGLSADSDGQNHLARHNEREKKTEQTETEVRTGKTSLGNGQAWSFAKSWRAVENIEKWSKLVVKSSVVPQQPMQLKRQVKVKGWLPNSNPNPDKKSRLHTEDLL